MSLVVAFALAGRVDLDLSTEPIGTGGDGVRFSCAISAKLQEIRDCSVCAYAGSFPAPLPRLRRPEPEMERGPSGPATFISGTESDYIHQPPFFQNFSMEPGTIEDSRERGPGIFGDSVRPHFSGGRDQSPSPAANI